MGLGRSGIGAIKLLMQKNEKVFAFDDNKKIVKEFENAKIFSNKVDFLKKINVKTTKNIDYIVLSPGICLTKYQRIAEKNNIKIIGELELAFQNCCSPVLAVTGTNGKTTTVNLLFEMIKKIDGNACMVGNVGNSFCEELSKKSIGTAVCEVSSFQLEHIEKFKPQMVGFLNIANDHLDRYKNFDEYFSAKKKIFTNFSTYSIAIFNFDDKKLFEFSKSLNCQKYYFSLKPLPRNLFGAFLDNENIVFRFQDNEFSFERKIVHFLGVHNLYNVMCASIMALLSGVKFESICETIKVFSLPEHRIEFVEKIDGVSFYDDSKGTNIHSTQNAISCFNQKTLLILGGKDKGENFDNLFQNLNQSVVRIFAFGETRNKIYKSAKKYSFQNIKKVKTLKDVFTQINTKEMEEKVVLFSPACSSFDQFSSYEARGNYFKSLVERLVND